MKDKFLYAPLYYFDIDIEWGHLRVGPLLLHWFNSSTDHDSWGSCTVTWDLKHSFLFCFNELKQKFEISHHIIDPDLARVMKGAKHF
jgi:hypothetical protein